MYRWSCLLSIVILCVGVFRLEAPPVAPAVNLVAYAGDISGVRATTTAYISHAQLQPFLHENFHRFALVPIYPTVK